MNRFVEEPVTLSDGTVLPAGSRITVCGSYNDPSIYDEPEKFTAARFVNTGKQFVTASADHMLFGHGDHACPGRFL